MAMLRVFWCILTRDLTLAMRRRTDVLTTLFFFVIVVSLFPLGVGTERKILEILGPGVVWVAALLASMLALERLFAADYEDGTLEQMLLTAQPLSLLVLAKIAAHWILTGLPLVLIAPLVGMQYHLTNTAIGVMMLSLLLGTPILSLIGAIGAALTLGLRGGGHSAVAPRPAAVYPGAGLWRGRGGGERNRFIGHTALSRAARGLSAGRPDLRPGRLVGGAQDFTRITHPSKDITAAFKLNGF